MVGEKQVRLVAFPLIYDSRFRHLEVRQDFFHQQHVDMYGCTLHVPAPRNGMVPPLHTELRHSGSTSISNTSIRAGITITNTVSTTTTRPRNQAGRQYYHWVGGRKRPDKAEGLHFLCVDGSSSGKWLMFARFFFTTNFHQGHEPNQTLIKLI